MGIETLTEEESSRSVGDASLLLEGIMLFALSLPPEKWQNCPAISVPVYVPKELLQMLSEFCFGSNLVPEELLGALLSDAFMRRITLYAKVLDKKGEDPKARVGKLLEEWGRRIAEERQER